jgi:hypothetical protein
VHGSDLIYSRSGNRQKLYRVSPLLLAQFGTYNKYFLPKKRDLPTHGLVTRFYVFDFGYANPNSSIAPMQMEFCPLVMGRDFLCEMITGRYGAAAPQVLTNPATQTVDAGANVTPGFLVNFLHTHNGVQRQWANKPLTNDEAIGSALYPLFLKDPALLPEGDTLTCVIQNLSNVTLQAQILFTGGEFDTGSYGQESGA